MGRFRRSFMKSGHKSRKKHNLKKKRSAMSWLPHISRFDVDFISGLVHGVSRPYPYEEEVIDLDEIPHDDLDDEVMLGTIRTDIVGIQYYKGTVNNGEMVCLEREPHNAYDKNAIRVLNLDRVQVGHLKRDMARPLAYIVDNNYARLEGTVPYGATNMYKMTVDLTLWGNPEHKQGALDVLRSHSVFLQVPEGSKLKSNAMAASTSKSGAFPRLPPTVDYSHVVSRREILSPAQVKNELDKLFESLQAGDKTTPKEPVKAIRSPLYEHQKQALNWMIGRENGDNLPPFWEKRHGGFYNSLTVSTSRNQPASIRGGILADDMGLGKTLEMIALILTNFVDHKSLAMPVPGRIRQKPKMKREVSCTQTKVKAGCSSQFATTDEQCPFEKIRALEAKIDSLDDEKENNSRVDEKASGSTSDSFKRDSLPMSVPAKTWLVPLKLRKLHEDDTGEIPVTELVSDEEGETCSTESVKQKNSTLGKDDNLSVKLPAETTPCASRPRRSSKKPARYIFSDSDEETVQESTYRVKDDILGEKVDEYQKGKMKSLKRKGKALCKRGQAKLRKDVEVIMIDAECPTLPDLDVEELPVALETARNDPEYMPGRVESESSDDDLPQIEVPFQANRAGVSSCDATTGRAPTDGPRATLIVCPLSVLSNWLNQLEEHVHENVHLEVYTYYGSSRTKNVKMLSQQDIVLTTYSTLQSDSKTRDKPLLKVHWLRVVLDEGHVIRNPKAQQTVAAVELKAERRWVLTGTPIQNSMKDLWSLINFLRISPLTDRMWWHRTIQRPLSRGDASALTRVQKLMANIALRRTKTTKLNDKPLVELPERNVFVERIELSEEERRVYTAMQNEGKIIISKYFQLGTLLHNYGEVLAILMRLRQMCCHPSLVARAAAAAKESQVFLENMKANPAMEADESRQKLVDTLLMVLNSGSDEECSVCLDSLKAPVITQCAHVFCRPCIVNVINNQQPNPSCPLCRRGINIKSLIDVPPESTVEDNYAVTHLKNWQSSAKVDALMNALVKLREEDNTVKSLVVSQFTSFLTLLEIPLKANGFSFARLDGTMSAQQRSRAIEEFSRLGPDSPTIFLLSLKAGGVGLNLTAASRVFLMDPAWNPAAEEQCFDRCHRLGQTRDVTVTKFVVEESVEERMLELQEKKRQLMQGAFTEKQTMEQRRKNRINDIKSLVNL